VFFLENVASFKTLLPGAKRRLKRFFYKGFFFLKNWHHLKRSSLALKPV
jgi:hypothetical protein